jgi:predicted nucleic acid-binding protein
LIDTARRSPRWQCIPVDQPILNDGLALFESRSDKDWSLTDCISIAVFRQQQIDQIFTTDHHFTQAGLGILMVKDS